jgi:hypothetical protein
MLILSVVLAALPLTTSALPADDVEQQALPSVPELLERIAANEALYENLEVDCDVTLEVTSEREPALLKDLEIIESAKGSYHSVAQANRRYLRDKSTSRGFGTEEPLQWDFVAAFDGGTLRTAGGYAGEEGGEYVQEPARPDDVRRLRPHVFPHFRYSGGRVSLADFLQNRSEPVQDHFEVTIEGVEEIAGHRCLVVRRVASAEEHKQNPLIHKFWLATERNYLPVKSISHFLSKGDDPPTNACRYGDLREIRTGVWFPHEMDLKVIYNQTTSEEYWKITSVDLSPEHPDAFFREVSLAP